MLARTNKTIKRVAFFGDATAKEGDKHFKDAKEVAKLLAENDYVIVNGGGPGVMLAATLGAKTGGGKVEVVILDPKKEPNNYEGTSRKNVRLANKIYTTEKIEDRMNKLIKVADAFLIFKGGTGTLAEIGTTWELARFDYGHHEPLIFYGKFWKKIINDIMRGLKFTGDERGVVAIVGSPAEVVSVLEKVKPR